MSKIRFGTDGWRAVIARDYTVANVERVAEATAIWMKQRGMHSVVIGYDCRFGGKMFSEAVASVMAEHGMSVYLSEQFVTTPMVSLGVVKHRADMGIVITASHNPPEYNGFKLKSAYGGPTVPSDIGAIEALIPPSASVEVRDASHYRNRGLWQYVDLEELYYRHVEEHFDMDAIRSSDIGIAYDAMYGAGQRIVPRLFPEAVLLHCDYNPSFKGRAPEPLEKNLGELKALMQGDASLHFGLANDGDADRIGLFAEGGQYIDSHRIMLLLLYYLAKYRGLKGKVVVTFSVTEKMRVLAEHFGFGYAVTPIGFKHIAEIMIREPVLIGGEESGGIAVAGHIPERDGVWNGLLLLEFMARTGKRLTELLEEIYAIVGRFAYHRWDLHIDETSKKRVIETLKHRPWERIGPFDVRKVEALDGYKFHLGDGEWVMIRPSGTEPVLRVYAQAATDEKVQEVLEATKKCIEAV